MTDRGERFRPMANEGGRIHAVSKLRIGPDGHVSHVLSGEAGPGSHRASGTRVLATAAEVVNAIHVSVQGEAVLLVGDPLPERSFVIVLHQDGRESIALDGSTAHAHPLHDMDRLDGTG